MRVLFLTAMVVITSLSTSTVANAEDIDKDLQSGILDATLKILISRTDDVSGVRSAGSGTLISNERYVDADRGISRRLIISTAAHVVREDLVGIQGENGVELIDVSVITLVNYLRDSSGQIRQSRHFVTHRNLEIQRFAIKRFNEVDAAFLIIDLKITSDYLKDVNPVVVSGVRDAATLTIGSDLFVAGCPIVMDPVIFKNRLLQRNIANFNFRHRDFMGHLVSRVLTGGNSGGGVYNSRGELIGLVTLRLGEDFGAFTGIEHILPLAIHDADVMPTFRP